MVGITGFGAYVPYYRLGVGTEAWKGRGERAIASFDEDSITMAVAAGLDCLDGADTGSIDALYFASTTSPFKEKQAATLVARAIDLRADIFTVDFAGSTRAGTAALKAAVDAVRAGTAGKVMVVIADERVPRPRSEFDASFGDGAAAFVIGDEGVVAEVEDICSYSHEIYDVWRVDGAVFPRSAEDRFVFQEGHLKAMKRAASSGHATATDLADWLVLKLGLPFREAHHTAGKIVALAESRGSDLKKLPLSELKTVEKRITEEVYSALDASGSVKSRTSYGGTAPANVKRHANRWIKRLEKDAKTR